MSQEMSQEQKIAWLAVGTFAAGVLAFFVLIAVFGRVIPAFAGFGLFGITGLGPIIFRKKSPNNIVGEDERDKAIKQKATLAGAMISYGAVILACMIPYIIYDLQGREVITVQALPWIAGVALFALFLSRSITLLILYGREKRHGEEGIERQEN